MKALLFTVTLAGCDLVFPSQAPIPFPGDASIDIDGPDGVTPVDAPPDDSGIDAPPDAFACTAHSQCAAMMLGTCCVNPGPAGYCTKGVIIATVCNPQP